MHSFLDTIFFNSKNFAIDFITGTIDNKYPVGLC